MKSSDDRKAMKSFEGIRWGTRDERERHRTTAGCIWFERTTHCFFMHIAYMHESANEVERREGRGKED